MVPRTDRLDRERLMFLAGQQSALTEHILCATAGLSSSAEVLDNTSNFQSLPVPNKTLFTAGQASSGTLGQQSMTGKKVRLPDALLSAQSKRTWAWPAAFAGMSVVAATFFVMLISRPGSGGIENIVQTSAPQAAPEAAAQEMTDTSDYTEQPRKYFSYFDMAFLSGADNRKTGEVESSYSNAVLLRQILAKGVDSWKPSETGAIDGKSINTRPLTNRELMKQLLDQAGAGPS